MRRSTQPQGLRQKAKQSRNPEITKAKILDAAIEEFAKYGLVGTRTEAIANRSGVAKALVCYYFDNKEKLYQAVLQQLVNGLNAAFQQINVQELSPEKALEAFIRQYIAYEVQNPYHGMIWFQEALQNQGEFGRQTGWQEGFKALTQLLEQGVITGVFRQIDPFLTTINIIGVCSFYFDAHQNLKHVDSERKLLSAEMVEKQMQEVVNLILAGVRIAPE